MKPIKISLILAVVACIMTSGCKQRGLSDYSTPEATYKTYLEQAKALRIVGDQRNYRRAIRCFSDDDWKWFEKNYDNIKCEKEELYKDLFKSKKCAYVFGRAIVPAGPSPDQGEFEMEKTSDSAVLTVKGYSEKIEFVKADRGWVMIGFFGIKKDKSE